MLPHRPPMNLGGILLQQFASSGYRSCQHLCTRLALSRQRCNSIASVLQYFQVSPKISLAVVCRCTRLLFHSQMELVHQTLQIEDQATRLSSTLQDHLPASGGCISARVRAHSPNSQRLLMLLFLSPLAGHLAKT